MCYCGYALCGLPLARENQTVLAFFVTLLLLRYQRFNQELCSLIFETKTKSQVSKRLVERKSTVYMLI